nr:hypothetical protein [Legionella oakridgensis]
MQSPKLSELLAYKNQRVIQYYCHYHIEVTPEQANQLFTDLLAWLWLNVYRQLNNRRTYLFGPLLLLDDLWHAFILHTRDYYAFCIHFFDAYIHHEIETPGAEHELSAEELADFLQDCFEHLGEEWVLRYFSSLLGNSKTD